MVTIILFISIFFGIAIFAPLHAAGLWLIVMITHGLLVQLLGESATHIPLYAGITVTLCTLIRGRWSGIQPSTLLLFGGLLIVMGLASIGGIDTGASLASMTLYVKAFLLALFMAGCIRHEEEIKTLTLYCLLGTVIGGLIAIYQHYTGTYSVNSYNVQRAGGIRGDPNDTAMLLITGVPLAFYWLLYSKSRFQKIMSAISLALIVFGIVLTGSRGGFLALLFISLLIYARKPKLQSTIAGIALVSILFVFAPDAYWARMQTLVTGKELKGASSLDQRADLLQRGLAILQVHPLLGVGPDNFSESYFPESPSDTLSTAHSGGKGDGGQGIVAHNLYLEFFVENGILGGLLLLMIFYKAMRNLMKYDRRGNHEPEYFGIGNTLAIALSGMLFSGLFLSQGKNSVLWFLIGVALATGQVSTRTTPNAIQRLQPGATLP